MTIHRRTHSELAPALLARQMSTHALHRQLLNHLRSATACLHELERRRAAAEDGARS